MTSGNFYIGKAGISPSFIWHQVCDFSLEIACWGVRYIYENSLPSVKIDYTGIVMTASPGYPALSQAPSCPIPRVEWSWNISLTWPPSPSWLQRHIDTQFGQNRHEIRGNLSSFLDIASCLHPSSSWRCHVTLLDQSLLRIRATRGVVFRTVSRWFLVTQNCVYI